MKPLILLLSATLLSACIDESSDDDSGSPSLEQEGVGFFIDSPVQGLSYRSASHNGTTDALGRFDYEAGETITFSLGEIDLPAVTTSKVVHVSDLFDGDIEATATINLARLLLTLDDDGDSDNGIQLSTAAVSAVNTSALASLNFSSSSFDSLIADYIAAVSNHSLVSAADAKEHIAETKAEAEGLLAGCGNECVPRIAYMDNIESNFPRHAQQAVPVNSDIELAFTSAFTLNLNNMRVEMFGVPKGSYENCRIDWPGFRCDDYGIDSYDLAQTFNFYSLTKSISGNSISFSPDTNLSANTTYIVHVYHDGETDDQDDYKTWWLFHTE